MEFLPLLGVVFKLGLLLVAIGTLTSRVANELLDTIEPRSSPYHIADQVVVPKYRSDTARWFQAWLKYFHGVAFTSYYVSIILGLFFVLAAALKDKLPFINEVILNGWINILTILIYGMALVIVFSAGYLANGVMKVKREYLGFP